MSLAKFLSFCLVLLIVSCSDDEKTYDKNKAISVFALTNKMEVDKSLEGKKVVIPAQISALQYPSNQIIENHSFNSIGKKKFLSRYNYRWSGYNNSFLDRYVFAPIIQEEKIFLLDASGILSCYAFKDKKKLWESRLFARKYLKTYQNPRIAYKNNVIYAIAGTNQIVAASAETGKILWSKNLSSIPVSAPLSDGKLVFVVTNDNKTYALDSKEGKLVWIAAGINKATAIFGASNLLLYKNLLISPYSSGEIYAINKTNGEVMWSQDLNINKAVNSDFYLNDIDATPIIKDDVLYSIGNGGLMMAIDVNKGNYLWKKELASISDFWLAADYLYLVNNDDKLLALNRKDGALRFITQLPSYKNPKKPETKVIYNGLVMAGDQLIISNKSGTILVVDPLDGKVMQEFVIPYKVNHAPIVVNKKIYLHAVGKYTINLIEIE